MHTKATRNVKKKQKSRNPVQPLWPCTFVVNHKKNVSFRTSATVHIQIVRKTTDISCSATQKAATEGQFFVNESSQWRFVTHATPK